MILGVVGTIMLCLLLLWYSPGKDAQGQRAYRIWSRAVLLMAISIAVLAGRVVLPEWICVLFGNALLMIGIARLQRALEVLGDPVPPGWHHLVVVAVAWLTIVPYTLIWPSIHARVIIISFGLAFSLAMLVWRVRRLPGLRIYRSAQALQTFALIGMLILLVRALVEISGIQPKTEYYEATVMDIVSYSYYAVGPLFLSLTFLMLLNDRAFSELERQAALDPLTGIFNRRNFDRHARRLLIQASRNDQGAGLLLIDADHFKSVNDRHGHHVGDRALQAIVAALQSQLRPGDVLARHGGEEFIVLLAADSAAWSLGVAERLRKAVENVSFLHAEQAVALRISIGVAFTAALDADPSQVLQSLIRRADVALYSAKREGRNRCMLAAA